MEIQDGAQQKVNCTHLKDENRYATHMIYNMDMHSRLIDMDEVKIHKLTKLMTIENVPELQDWQQKVQT